MMSNYGSSNYGSGNYSVAEYIQDIIPGIEAKHVWSPNLAVDGVDEFVMNDRSDITVPYVAITGIKGSHSLADLDETRDKSRTRSVEVLRKATRRGKTVVYEGELRARTRMGLRSLQKSFQRSFERQAEGRLDLYSVTEGEEPVFCYALPIAGEPEEPTQAHTWKSKFSLSFRLGDSKYYRARPSIEAAGSGVVLITTNEGDAATDNLVLKVTGPITTPELIRGGVVGVSEVLLKFNLVLAAGETLTVDFRRRTAVRNTGADAGSLLDVLASDWWDEGIDGLPKGTHHFLLMGAGTTAATQLEVLYHPVVM